jgi:hypothetical protein
MPRCSAALPCGTLPIARELSAHRAPVRAPLCMHVVNSYTISGDSVSLFQVVSEMCVDR